MSEVLVLGDEAVALGAIDAGMAVAYGYPGTPSTEIMEYLQHYGKKHDRDLIARWCTNEKTSYEGAVGVSLAGKRSLVTMKHVGLNVAADAFMNSALLKIHGGLVLAVADDPGMHSSQNEQDSRFFSDYAGIICLEPRNHQEAYLMTIEAFTISEMYNVPVILKLVTRLSHSRAKINRGSTLNKTARGVARDKENWMALPSLSRKNWTSLLEQQNDFITYSESSENNPLYINKDFNDFGVITTGLGGNYYLENESDFAQRPSHLHIGLYPAPLEKIKKLIGSVKKVIVIEEGYPMVEKMLKGILTTSIPVHGKLDNTIPPSGELNPDNVRRGIGLKPLESYILPDLELPGRPPQLCQGCPHIYAFNALNEARKSFENSVVTSDIGCYALGALPPFNAADSILCMGASVGMARGASEAGAYPVIGTIGDGTFLHSGLTALIDAVSTNTDMTLVIMDNSTTAMTGGQDTILTSSQIRRLVSACGVDEKHIREVTALPKYHEENTKVFIEEMEHRGLSVVITLRECIQTVKRK